MRTDLLLGTQFANGTKMKAEFLRDYTQWKAEYIYELDKMGTLSLHLGQLMGLKEREYAKKRGKETPLLEIEELTDLLAEDGCHHYYITDSVIKWSNKMPIPEDFRLRELGGILDGKRQLNFMGAFYRYEKIGPIVNVISTHEQENPLGKQLMQMLDFYRIDLKAEVVHTMDAYMFRNFKEVQQRESMKHLNQMMDRRDAALAGEDIRGKAPKLSLSKMEEIFQQQMQLKAQYRNNLLKLLTFIHISEVQEITVQPGQGHKSQEDEIEFTNRERYPYTIINNNWNKIIKVGGSVVKPHHRRYYIGAGRTELVRRFIMGHPRAPYVLNAGKLKDEIKQSLEDSLDKQSLQQQKTPPVPGKTQQSNADGKGALDRKKPKIDYKKLKWKGRK